MQHVDMKFINPIYLISVSEKVNDVGDLIPAEKEKKVLAHVQSVRQTEFYQASASGFKPEVTFIIRNFEYNDEKFIRLKDKKYKVIRTFSREDGYLEITCIGAVNNASAT